MVETFDYEKIRDSSGIRVVPGVEFKPLALISGSAKVGFRQLDFKNPAIPDYTGPVASVNLAYTLMGMTRFGVQVDRDVLYSFEQTQPYYVLTGIIGTITQGLSRTWDVQARIGDQRLAYQRIVRARRERPASRFRPRADRQR